MPCYNYKCTECQFEFEKIVTKYDTETPELCPECGSNAYFFMPLSSRNSVKFFFNYLAPDA